MRKIRLLSAIVIIIATCLFGGRSFADPTVEWSYPVGTNTSSPAIVDLDGDGTLEIVLGLGYSLAALKNDGTILWRCPVIGGVYSSPTIADINGDGKPEAVVGTYDQGNVCAISNDGTLLWSCQPGDPGAIVVSSPTIADIDGDGNVEIIVTSSDGKVCVLNSDGTILWRYQPGGGVLYFNSPAVADLNGDGKLEIVMESSDGKVYAINYDGTLLWSYQTGGLYPSDSSPVIADLNGDGELEVTVGSNDGYVYTFNSQGALLWRYQTGAMIHSSPSVADLDGDGKLEVVVGSDDTFLYVLSDTGTLLWRYQTGGMVQSSPSIVDLDGDGTLEIVIGSYDGKVYALTNDGMLLWAYQTEGPIDFFIPAIIDIDGDGEIEVLVGGRGGVLTALGSVGTSPDEYESHRKKYIITAQPDTNGNIYRHYLDEDWGGQGHGRPDKEVKEVADENGAKAYQYFYHENSNVVRIKYCYEFADYTTDPSNISLTGLVVSYEYDATGRVVVKILQTPNEDGELIFTYMYYEGTDIVQYKESFADAARMHKVSRTEYDNAGNFVKKIAYEEIEPGWVTDPISLVNNFATAGSTPVVDFYDGKMNWFDYSTSTLYTYNSLTGIMTSAIIPNFTQGGHEVFDHGQMAWYGLYSQTQPTSEIFFWNGTNTIRLTNNSLSDEFPFLSNGQIAWNNTRGGDDIWFYNGTQIQRITNSSVVDDRPDILNGQITWQSFSGGVKDIYLYDGSTTRKITNGLLNVNRHELFPKMIGTNRVIWGEWSSDGKHKLYVYNGSSIVKLSDGFGGTHTVAVGGGCVVWAQSDGSDIELFFYDGTKTTQLTNNSYDDSVSNVSLSDGRVVWAELDGHDGELYLYDGKEKIQLTDNDYLDCYPWISGNRIGWIAGNSYERTMFAEFGMGGIIETVYERDCYESKRKKYIVTIQPDTNGNVYRHYLDEDWGGQGHGRPDKEVKEVADINGAKAYQYFYHENTNVVRIKYCYESADYATDPSSVTFSDKVATYEYDLKGRVTTMILEHSNADGELVFEFEYSGDTDKITHKHSYKDIEKKKKDKDYEYDEAGNCVTVIEYKNADYALLFDGIDDLVRIPDSSSLDLFDGMTIEAWIRSYGTAGARVIVSKWDDITHEWSYIFKDHNSSDKLRIELSNTYHNNLADLAGTTSIPTNGDWVHVAATYNSGTVKLFFNGMEDSSMSVSGNINNSAADLFIGAVNGWSGLESFSGLMDEVRVWNYARTQEQLQGWMNNTLFGNEQGLVGYWDFNEGSGLMAGDSTGYNNDGSIYGAQWIERSSGISSIKHYYSSGHKKSELLSDPDENGYSYYEYLDEDFNGNGFGRVSKKQKSDGSYELIEYWDNTGKIKIHKKHAKDGREIESDEYYSDGKLKKKTYENGSADCYYASGCKESQNLSEPDASGNTYYHYIDEASSRIDKSKRIASDADGCLSHAYSYSATTPSRIITKIGYSDAAWGSIKLTQTYYDNTTNRLVSKTLANADVYGSIYYHYMDTAANPVDVLRLASANGNGELAFTYTYYSGTNIVQHKESFSDINMTQKTARYEYDSSSRLIKKTVYAKVDTGWVTPPAYMVNNLAIPGTIVDFYDGKMAFFNYSTNTQYIYDVDTGMMVSHVIPNYEPYPYVRFDRDQIVWQGFYSLTAPTAEIFFWNGTQTIQLTNNNISDEFPRISNGKITWFNTRSNDDVFLYDGNQVNNLTNNNSLLQQQSDVLDNYVTWVQYNQWPAPGDIFLYDGSNTIRITNDNVNDGAALLIGDGKVVWSRQGDVGYDLYAYNGSGVTKLCDNFEGNASSTKYGDGWVVWQASDGNDNELYLYDGTKTIQLTNNNYDDNCSNVSVGGGRVVWAEFDGLDNELFLYDGTEKTQLTNNSYGDSYPWINGNQIGWMAGDKMMFGEFRIGYIDYTYSIYEYQLDASYKELFYTSADVWQKTIQYRPNGSKQFELFAAGLQGSVSQREYNEAEQLIGETDINGTVRTYYVSGRMASISLVSTDASGHIYYHYIDENWNGQGYGRIDKQILASPDSNGAVAYIYEYFAGTNKVSKKLCYSNADFTNVVATYIYLQKAGQGQTIVVMGSDLFIDFGSSGLYKYSLGKLTKISTANPDSMLVLGSDLYVDFGSSGLYKYSASTWKKLGSANPESMLAIAANLFIDYGSLGLYKYTGSAFAKLSSSNPESMVALGTDLFVDFGSLGLYKYASSKWTKLGSANPESILALGDILFIDYGALGLYKYASGTFTKLSSTNPESMLALGTDLYVDFGSLGLYKYAANKWTKLSSANPESVVVSGTTLYVDFGATGLYKYSSNIWTKISSTNPESMVVSGSDLIVDFGTAGLYRYSSGAWKRLSTANPESIMLSGTDLIVDFGALGLYKYSNESWTKLSTLSPYLNNASYKLNVKVFADGSTCEYNSKGHIIIKLNKDGSRYDYEYREDGSTKFKERYYGADGKVVSVIEYWANGNTIHFKWKTKDASKPDDSIYEEYDSQGNLTVQRYDDGSYTAYSSYSVSNHAQRIDEYDKDGNLIVTFICNENGDLAYASYAYTMKNIAANGYNLHISDNERLVWSERRATDPAQQVYFYDGTNINKLTNALYDITGPDMNSEGAVVWAYQDPIYLYDGTNTKQVILSYDSRTLSAPYPNQVGSFMYPSINDKGQIVCEGENILNRSWTADIWFYDGSNMIRLAAGIDRYPITRLNNNGAVVWMTGGNAYLYDGLSTKNLGTCNSSGPQISDNGNVVWANGEYVYLYNGSATITISNGLNNASGSGINPQINSKGQVVWQSSNNEIYVYDNGQVKNISNAVYYGFSPQINDQGEIAWVASGGSAIYFYDGYGTCKIADNISVRGSELVLNNEGTVAWWDQRNGGVEIGMAKPKLNDGTLDPETVARIELQSSLLKNPNALATNYTTTSEMANPPQTQNLAPNPS